MHFPFILYLYRFMKTKIVKRIKKTRVSLEKETPYNQQPNTNEKNYITKIVIFLLTSKIFHAHRNNRRTLRCAASLLHTSLAPNL